MPGKRFQFLIYDSTAGAVEHTIASSQIGGVSDRLGGQSVDWLKGQTVSQPWQVDILDDANFFTSKLADSGGRTVMLGRLVQLQSSVDGSTYANLVTGRISKIIDGVSHYSVSVDDERWKERNSDIFTKNGAALGSGTTSLYAGTRLIPPGIDGEFVGFHRTFRKFQGGLTQLATEGNFVLLEHSGGGRRPGTQDHEWMIPAIVNFIESDMKEAFELASSSTSGAFENLRVNVDGTDREVIGFSILQTTAGFPQNREQVVSDLKRMAEGQLEGNVNIWVLWSTSTGPSMTDVYVHAADHEPTNVVPLHIGGDDIAPFMHPFEAARDIYDEIDVRYSTDAIQALIDNPDYGAIYFRITAKQNAARWLEDNIYGPLQVAPLIDVDGKIAPTPVGMPVSSDVGDDVSTLTLYSSSNLANPHPTWNHADPVTRIKYEYTHLLEPNWAELENWPMRDVLDRSGVQSADLLREEPVPKTTDHDRIDQIGVNAVDFKLHGYHIWREEVGTYDFYASSDLRHPNDARFVAEWLARSIFARQGDGAITGEFLPYTSSDTPSIGDFVRINLDTFPNPLTQARGSTYIGQVTAIAHDVAGPICGFLGAGPSQQPLATPTVTLSSSTSQPKHQLTANVTGLTSGASFQLSMANGTAEPASTSLNWSIISTTGSTGGPDVLVDRLASGTTYYVRARQFMPGRIASNWSTAPSAQTESLTAPSAIATSSITGNTANLFWTNGETDYPPQVLLDQSATCPSSGLETYRYMKDGSDEVKLEGLTLDTTHCAAVRHADAYGGFSDVTSTLIQTTTSPASLTAPQGVYVVAGAKPVTTG